MNDPLLLLTLLILPLLVWLRRRKGTAAALLLPSGSWREEASAKLPATLRWRLRNLPFWLRLAALLLIALALARPTRVLSVLIRLPSESVDIVLVLDCSGSMEARDYEINGKEVIRLEVSKAVVRDFIDSRPDDAFGLVLFGLTAATQSPVTLDHSLLLQLLNAVSIDKQVSGQRTAIGTALLTAADRLRKSQAKSKVIVLLTDGENNAGLDPIEAAKAVKKLGLKLYLVGAGGSEPYRQIGRDANGLPAQVVVNPLDEAQIKAITEAAGGVFFRTADAKALREAYAEIGKMEKTKKAAPRFRTLTDFYSWLIWPALGLLLLEMLLAQTWLRRLP